jgi:hypothetical protein
MKSQFVLATSQFFHIFPGEIPLRIRALLGERSSFLARRMQPTLFELGIWRFPEMVVAQ